jgi:glycerol-3-phosphate dehydrogenase
VFIGTVSQLVFDCCFLTSSKVRDPNIVSGINNDRRNPKYLREFALPECVTVSLFLPQAEF